MLTALSLLGVVAAAVPPGFMAGHTVEPGPVDTRVTTTLIWPAPDSTLTLALRAPLPAGTTLTSSHATALRDARGLINGVAVTPVGAPSDWRNGHAVTLVELQWTVPGVMTPSVIPLVADVEVQRVRMQGGWQVEPEAGSGLERHVGFLAPQGMDAHARHAVDRMLDDRLAGPQHQRIYLTGGVPLRGRLVGPGDVTGRGWLGAAAAFPLAVGGLWWWQRRLRQQEELEEAERILAADDARFET